MTNSDMQSATTRITGPGSTLGELEAYYEAPSRQRGTARISTITKLPRPNRASLEEALTRTVDSVGKQNGQMSIRMSELERAVHVERKSLREEITRNRTEVSKNEKRLKERADELLTRNLLRKKWEAEEIEKGMKTYLEQLRNQQEQTLATPDTRIHAMMDALRS